MLDIALRRWLHSRLDDEPKDFAYGYLDGREWASMGFGEHERDNLREFHAGSTTEAWLTFFRDEPETPSSALERLYFVMNPERIGECDAFEEFRYDFLDWALDFRVGETGEWARGFAEAALEHWDGAFQAVATCKREPSDRQKSDQVHAEYLITCDVSNPGSSRSGP